MHINPWHTCARVYFVYMHAVIILIHSVVCHIMVYKLYILIIIINDLYHCIIILCNIIINMEFDIVHRAIGIL